MFIMSDCKVSENTSKDLQKISDKLDICLHIDDSEITVDMKKNEFTAVPTVFIRSMKFEDCAIKLLAEIERMKTEWKTAEECIAVLHATFCTKGKVKRGRLVN